MSPRDAGADLPTRDAAGDLDGVESGDAANVDLRARDTGPAADGDRVRDGSQDADGARARVLSLVLKDAPWYASQATSGIAVDSLNRVYVGDRDNVYVVDGTSLGIHLTAAEAAGPTASHSDLGDLDIGPDDRLYIAASAFFTGTGGRTGIVRSSMAHQAEWWVEVAPLDQLHKVAVIDDGYLAVIKSDGFWTLTATGGELVYDAAKLESTNGCTCQDLVAAPSGVFLYQPGCNGYPLLRGNVDGTAVDVLYNTAVTTTTKPASAVSADNFLCAARDPSGGFYIIVDDVGDRAPRLYHVAEDAQGTTGLTWIPTVPSFKDAKNSQGEVFAFRFCSIAAARDGTVFFHTYHQLWKVSP